MVVKYTNEQENLVEWIITLRGPLEGIEKILEKAQKKAQKLGVEIIE